MHVYTYRDLGKKRVNIVAIIQLVFAYVSLSSKSAFQEKAASCGEGNESFGKMFSTFLHELSHALGGYDGDRSFSDCLTVLIQKCIKYGVALIKYQFK